MILGCAWNVKERKSKPCVVLSPGKKALHELILRQSAVLYSLMEESLLYGCSFLITVNKVLIKNAKQGKGKTCWFLCMRKYKVIPAYPPKYLAK